MAKKRTTRKAKASSKAAGRSSAKKKAAAKRTSAKKGAAKKPTAKKKATRKKTVAKKSVTKKAAAKKAAKKTARKPAKKTTPTKKAKASSTKSASRKVVKKTGKKVAAKKTAKLSAAKQAGAKKPAAPKAAGKAKAKQSSKAHPANVAKPLIYEPKTPQHDLAELTSLPPEKQCKTSAGAGLNARDLEQFRQLLLDKRAELRGDVTAMRSQAFGTSEQVGDESRMPLHMADLGSDNFEHELTLALVEGEQVILREIEEALERIKNRTYGICLATGRPIGKKRLTAKPWAKYCYEYTLAQERGAR